MSDILYRYRKTFGPGILFACTAIGVSHLVQSTRAGAEFGFMILGFVILANVLKYPFFEHGSRYANVTGTSIIDGYEKLGRKFLILYLGITLGSMFFVTAAVGFVTAGFFENLFQIEFLGIWTMVLLFTICGVILCIGKFGTLDGIIKIIGFVLIVSTIAAFVLAFINGPVEQSENFLPRELWNDSGIFFLIALMGWMPTAVDLSTWNSIWTIEKLKVSKNSFKEIMFDFRFGYLITIILSLFFLTLGCFLMFGSGEEIPNSSSLFASKLVSLYTSTLGDWSYLLISICAFSVMFSTTVSVIDGYSRSMSLTLKNLINVCSDKYYFGWLLVSCILPIIIIFNFMNDFKKLIDLATTISFIIAPFCAILNHYLINSKFVSQKFKPSRYLNVLSYSGIVFLVAFCIIYFIII